MGTNLSVEQYEDDYEEYDVYDHQIKHRQIKRTSGSKNQKETAELESKKQLERLRKRYQFPAEITAALNHRRAKKFGWKKEKVVERKNEDICPCCKQYILNQDFNVCSQPTTFLCGTIQEGQDFLPSGIALFFTYIKYIIFMCLIRFFFVDGYNLMSSLINGEYCQRDCSKSIWTYSSIMYKINAKEQIQMTNIFSFITIFVLIGYSLIYRRILISLYDKLDQKETTQDDFSIFVTNIPIIDIPQGGDSEHHQMRYDENLLEMFDGILRPWIQRTFEEEKQFSSRQYLQKSFMKIYRKQKQRITDTVKSVSLCFDLAKIDRIRDVREDLMEDYEDNVGEQNDGQNIQISQSENQSANNLQKIDYLNKLQIKLCHQFSNQYKDPVMGVSQFVGSAFVSFQYQHYRDYILREYQDNHKVFTMQGKQLKITRASHPSQITWENFVIRPSHRWAKLAVSFLILFTFLIVGFQILAYSDTFKDFVMQFIENQGEKLGSPLFLTFGGTCVSFITTFVTIAINWFLQIFSGWLTDWQRHATKSDEKFWLTIKLVITQFVNTVLIYYFVAAFIQKETINQYMAQQGFIFTISSLIVTQGIQSVAANFLAFSPDQVWAKIKFYWNYWGKKEGDEVDGFQVNVNQDYELEEFDLAPKYAFYILQIMTVSFYGYLVPIGGFAMVFILIASFWVDKYNLFKKSSLPYSYKFELSMNMVKIGEFSILIYAIGVLIFSIKVDQVADPLNIAGVAIAAIYSLLNILSYFWPSWVEEFFFGRQKLFQMKSYEACIAYGLFQKTYWSSNPATFLKKQPIIRNKVPVYVQIDKKIKAMRQQRLSKKEIEQ